MLNLGNILNSKYMCMLLVCTKLILLQEVYISFLSPVLCPPIDFNRKKDYCDPSSMTSFITQASKHPQKSF